MRSVAVVLVLGIAASLHADILHLRDGSRHSGEVVRQTDTHIYFRVRLPDGSGALIRSFPRARIVRIEPGQLPEAPRPAPAPARRAADASHRYTQMLREAVELSADDDPLAALRALQKAVLNAPPDVLLRLEQTALELQSRSLDEWLAHTRLTAVGSGAVFRITYTTPYERPALGRLVAAELEARLNRRHAGRTVVEWAAQHEDYRTLRPDTRALVADTTRAVALIATQLRWDPALEIDRAERVRLRALRTELSRLAAHLLALPGYTEAPHPVLSQDDPAAVVAAELAAAATQSAPAAPLPGDTGDAVDPSELEPSDMESAPEADPAPPSEEPPAPGPGAHQEPPR